MQQLPCNISIYFTRACMLVLWEFRVAGGTIFQRLTQVSKELWKTLLWSAFVFSCSVSEPGICSSSRARILTVKGQKDLRWTLFLSCCHSKVTKAMSSSLTVCGGDDKKPGADNMSTPRPRHLHVVRWTAQRTQSMRESKVAHSSPWNAIFPI